MSLTLVEGPAALPVSLADVKAHLRITHDDEDASLEGLLKSAVALLDGPSGLLGRCLVEQTWRLALPAFPSELVLPLPPVQLVAGITYYDSDDLGQTLPPAAYRVAGLGGMEPATIRPIGSWPRTFDAPDAVMVDFVAGFGEAPDDVPPTLRQAILGYCGHLYLNRESFVLGPGGYSETPLGLSDAVRAYRVWAF